jgi:hypothetical protein
MGKKIVSQVVFHLGTHYMSIVSNVKVAKIFDDSHHNHQHGNHNEGLECLRQWRLEEVSRNIADHQRKGQINPGGNYSADHIEGKDSKVWSVVGEKFLQLWVHRLYSTNFINNFNL